ncbi:pyroglutamyl-peptidase I [Virgibacillus necropolis]|uniref:Pyroglutamyl-peptidase I n=1 Tax=Virgibacillus necropolis TaxID=163877 RepID=A0A221MEQ0_9BACI|nr:pyroglutamyl-peptidase I [Virgibacillus necropolis]ASN06127.1 peptidase C15 [Virgibacillus necropolis]
MKKLLLTGFEPFLDFPVNPTAKIVEELDGSTLNGYEIVSKVLTVDFSKSGKQLLDEIKNVQPDALISLGLAGGRYKVTPERIAINCNDGESDNKGHVPNGEAIFENGQDGLFSTLPLDKMVERLVRSGLPAEISNTAGTYLCNNVMYHGLYHFQKENLSVPSGFIHIPASHDLALKHKGIPSWSNDDLIKAVRTCIECL